ncbi:hypothetical protein EVC45_42170 [Paraburkholderia sp. UYCP14C]|uniref:hypothetical protein n=1 Tax=Paraburkholderia sp. UYCP14C TaxID=2511130 RepID=UPI00102095B5|nr:hypothetical protein [Paraburkholderia sp. UYCP14C]RZF23823.1 hypothetical protein EVC45_42170 [Paraburkholderia sp. UYCP14C]
MPQSVVASRSRLGAAAMACSGILFVLYPALRPFSDENSIQGAAAFASGEWLLAHMLAMVAFTLLPLGLLGLHNSLQDTAVERDAYRAVVLNLIGTGLALPFYGGEAYGLHAVGQEALIQRSAAILSLATVVRAGPGLVMFIIGLLLLAASAIIVAMTIWRSVIYPRWSGLPFAAGVALYIPQFFGNQPLRITHGLLLGIGCAWIAAGMWSRTARHRFPAAPLKP